MSMSRAGLLPCWYDVDTATELERLRADLANGDADAPHARAFLSRLD